MRIWRLALQIAVFAAIVWFALRYYDTAQIRLALNSLSPTAVFAFFAFMLVSRGLDSYRWLTISRIVIGLTVVAFATSSPELAATLTAAFQGSPDMVIGTVLGSNIANLGLILGVGALVFPLAVIARFIRRSIRSAASRRPPRRNATAAEA